MQLKYSEFQYPKLLLLLITIVSAYALFKANVFWDISHLFNTHGLLSVFLAGFLFAYGFTAAFAIGFFVTLAPQLNPWIAAPLAGFGALLGDLIIFHFIRTSFQDEFDRLKLVWIIKKVRSLINGTFKSKIRKYFLWIISGFIIASPLPDELAVSILSGVTNINKNIFAVLSFLFNTTGILLILIAST